MKKKTGGLAAMERDIMTETERELLKRDIVRVAEEYFETDGQAEIDIKRTERGYSVCLLLHARRIKKIWSPQ